MSRKEEFEALLAYFASAPVGFASGPAPAKVSDDKSSSGSRNVRGTEPRAKARRSRGGGKISDEVVLREVRKVKKLLKNNPSLFSGDPNGFFTYEHPVLAAIAYAYQSHLLHPSVAMLAGEEKKAISKANFLGWAKTGVHLWLSRNDKAYKTLMGMTPRESIRIEKDIVRIAVIGDAGFSGQAQRNVLDSITERHLVNPFDLLIHLGDVYFAGSEKDFLENFLAPFREVGPRVLALVGNHDLYFGGGPFLSVLAVLRQPGRYFCVENPHWRIACLDTALPAETLGRIFGRLDKGQLMWLDKHLRAHDGKETILMSHHYVISGWEKSSGELKRQLASRLNKIFSWYWGHEHGCATYDKKTVGFYGACVGNGAFLEPWKSPALEPSPKWYAKGRCSCYQKRAKFWPHGYLELELQPTRIIEKYHLEGDISHTRTLKRA